MALSSLSRSRCASPSRGDRLRPPAWSPPCEAPARRLAAAGLAAVMVLLGACDTPSQALLDASATTHASAASAAAGARKAAGTPDGCAAPAAWFPHSKTPEPDPNQPFESLCDFHQWAWQSFLWLTQTSGGKLRFETFPSLQDVISGKDSSGTRGPMLLTIRTQKGLGPHRPISEIQQANSLGVLVDHAGRAGYYSQFVNPAMFQQIVSQRWNDPTVLNQISPTTVFATGNVELKALWKIVQPGEDTRGFYVRPALVSRLVLGPNGTIQTDSSAPPLQVRVALAGLHVVGWVKGHPEAVWASFEQRNNAPDLAPNQSPSAPVSNRNWTYYTANTPDIGCNQIDSTNLKLDPKTQTLKPVTQVCRQFPYGMVAGTPTNDPNLQAILSLNASVQRQLGKDVARNYFEVGAVWIHPPTGPVVLPPNSTLQQMPLAGSTLLNNSVVETFTQNVVGNNNCFGCHNTMMYNPPNSSIPSLQGTDINLSHVILEAYVQNQNQRKEKR
jgi:hypothetical protein